MKKHIIIFSLLVALFATSFHTTVFAHERYAIYNYRNDGDFSAFLNCDVDSITFSNIDLEGRAHPNVVVQEVWTPDSVYRIPLAAIDSIAFQAPKTIIKDDVFLITDEHIPFTMSVDSLGMVFDASIPQYLLPSEGDVLVSETFDSPFEEGFVGRVAHVKKQGQTIEVTCVDANLLDIYEQLIVVGKLVGDSTATPDNVPRRLPKRILGFDNINLQDSIHFGIGKQTVKKNGWDWISLEYTPGLIIDYVLYIHEDDPVHFKLAITGKHELNMVVDCELGDKLKYEHEVWPCNVELGNFYGFRPTLKLGLFFKSEAKAHVKGKIPVVISHTLGFDYHGSGLDIDSAKIIKDFDMTFKEPTLDFKLDGSVTFGLGVDVGLLFLHQRVASLDAVLKMGPKITTSFDLSANDIARDPGIYSVLKNTKVSLDFDIGVDAEYSFLKKKARIKPGLGWPGVKSVNQWAETPDLKLFQWSWPLFECYLLPEFKSHVINNYDGSNLTFSTCASRELFLPVKLGAVLESKSGKTTQLHSQKYWRQTRDFWASNYETTFLTLKGTDYTCCPVVEFLGCEIEATPEVKINTQDQSFTMLKDQVYELDKPDANASYIVVKSFDPRIATASIKDSKIILTAHELGSTNILLLNIKNNINSFINVNVAQSITPLSLSEEEQKIVIGFSKSFVIQNGSGVFTVMVDGSNVSATLKGNKLSLKAADLGVSTVIVTDVIMGITASMVVKVVPLQRGDVNCDAEIDENDYGELLLIYSERKQALSTFTADVNGDGSISYSGWLLNNADAKAMIDSLDNHVMKSWNGYPFDSFSDDDLYQKLDINYDGEITVADFNRLLNSVVNGQILFEDKGDLDGDGSVTWRDVVIWHVMYVESCGGWSIYQNYKMSTELIDDCVGFGGRESV